MKIVIMKWFYKFFFNFSKWFYKLESFMYMWNIIYLVILREVIKLSWGLRGG